MNLLKFSNRFNDYSATQSNIDKQTGYLWAMADLLKYLEVVTQFNPEKRMIDSVDILDSITTTNSILIELHKHAEKELSNRMLSILKGVNLSSDKVNSFLKDQLSETDKEIEQEFKDRDDLKDIAFV